MPDRPHVTSALAPALALATVLVAAFTLAPASARAQDEPYDPEARLAAMGVTLPVPGPNRGAFDRAVRTGNLVFLAGHAPCGEWDGEGRGKVPSERTLEEAQAAARQVAICLLGSLKAEVGDLARVTRIVRVFGMVNADPDFTGHSQVMNAASEFLNDVFGARGRHVRAAVGMGSLPANLTVEIEMVVEVDPG
jgi:enamine deaminase RidA (YjgF/YER057c/UK114 family)